MIARMRNRTSASDAPTPDPVPTDRLADWVTAGIITQEQADRIAAHELSQAVRRPTTPTASASLLVEALGYVGGVIILVGAVLLATEFWDELGVPGRLAVVGGAAVVMVLAGVAVPERAGEQGRRLRAVLWAAATGAFAGFMGLLAADVLGLFDSGLLTSAATAAVAVVLWWLRPTNLQHLVAAVALAATVATALARIGDAEYLPGTGIWAVGLVWFLLALGGLLRPRRFALTLGAAVAIVGALLLMIMSSDAGIALTLASAAAVVAMAVVMTDLTLLAVGAVGLLFALPIAVSTWFGGTFAAPIALLGAGVLLVVAALWIARRRNQPDDDAEATPGTAPLET
jgi:MFS family permease